MWNKIRAWYRKQAFFPSAAGGLLCNPFYWARRPLRREIEHCRTFFRGELLDVGCGTAPYRSLFPDCHYTGLEFDCEEMRQMGSADYYYDGKHFPFPPESFDGILSSQVLEHVFNPQEFLSECHRVLRNDGMMLITTPFVWDEHSQPYDFARYSSFGVAALLKQSGFEIVYQAKTGTDLSLFFQMYNLFVFKTIRPKSPRLRMILILLLTAPANVLCAVLRPIFPKNNDLYLDNIVLARKKA